MLLLETLRHRLLPRLLPALMVPLFAYAQTATEPALNYAELLTRTERPAEDRARDAASRPAEMLALLDVRPGQRVLDFQSAGGYFTELLSYAVGPTGEVLAHNHSREGVLGPEVLERRYGNGRLSNTMLVFARHNDLDLPSASLDSVLMSMVYHDTYWHGEGVDWGPVDQQALLHELYDALKPDGVILVIDHQATPGSDPYTSAVATHRIDRAIVLRDFTQAGFILKRESNLLRNAKDDPQAQIFTAAVYRDTDRFVLLFGKQ
jgi:predicted methyltransferase